MMNASKHRRLRENALYFQRCLEQAKRCKEIKSWNAVLGWAACGGRVGWKAHPGFYTSVELESVLLEVGRNLGSKKNFSGVATHRGGRHWLHVLTAAATAGGHTRFVERWIRRQLELNDDIHSVLLLEQKRGPVPDWLCDAIGVAGGSVILLDHSRSLLERALELRSTARAFDVVVQHVHPHDPIPAAAFGVADLPPILYLNHADHVYWTGLCSADRIIDIRRKGHAITSRRRTADGLEFLPIPLLRRTPGDKAASRRRLGLPQGKVILLSIGGEYKFKPYGGLNFIEAALELCRRHKEVLVLVIGPRRENNEWKEASEKSGGRLMPLGAINGIEDYYNACDIYLESFPLGSLTASLDAALYKKPIVLSPSPLLPRFTLDHIYDGLEASRSSVEEYLACIGNLVTDSALREATGARQMASVCDIHSGAGWNRHLETLIRNLPSEHRPGGLVTSTIGEEGPEDVVWADMQSASGASVQRTFRGGLRLLKGDISDIGIGWNKILSYAQQAGISIF